MTFFAILRKCKIRKIDYFSNHQDAIRNETCPNHKNIFTQWIARFSVTSNRNSIHQQKNLYSIFVLDLNFTKSPEIMRKNKRHVDIGRSLSFKIRPSEWLNYFEKTMNEFVYEVHIQIIHNPFSLSKPFRFILYFISRRFFFSILNRLLTDFTVFETRRFLFIIRRFFVLLDCLFRYLPTI